MTLDQDGFCTTCQQFRDHCSCSQDEHAEQVMPTERADGSTSGSADLGAVLLDRIRGALVRYVVLPSQETADAVTLWIAATHGQSVFEHAPRLAIVAPEKRCGKSRLLDVIEALCHEPLITVNATVAALFRSISEDNPPTLLVDEADAIFGTRKAAEANEELRALLNAGHQRRRPALRCVGQTQEVKEFPTFAMAALAGIGDLPDTIMDRSVIVRMRRRASGERADPYRTRRDAAPLAEIRDEFAAWLADRLDELARAEPQMPVEDREADTWEPLVAVADLAGGPWPARARHAAVTLCQQAREADTDTSLSLRLLADLRDVFGDADALHGNMILERLHAIEDAPWADWYGKPLDARTLANKLHRYEVKPRNVRLPEGVRKGYRREDLADAWSRYTPLVGASATSATAATAQTSPVADTSAVADAHATHPTVERPHEPATELPLAM